MSEDRTSGGPDDRNEDAGEPISSLEGFDLPTSPSFLARLRRRIQRRQVTGHFASLAWHVPKLLLVEFLELIFCFFESPSKREGDSK